MKYYSGAKKSEIMKFESERLELGKTILNEVSQTKKYKSECSLSSVVASSKFSDVGI